jgi:small subunit ribosomal protein S8
MSMTDPIADMLTRIRNATQAGHRRVQIPASNQKQAMAQLLKDQGYIDKFEILDDNAQGTLRVFLKYFR